MLPALWQITIRQWERHKVRLTLTVLGIALGVAVFFGIRTANVILLSSLSSTIEKIAGKATLQITAGEAGVPEVLLEKVRATAGVSAAEPVIEVITTTGFASEGNLLVLGVDTAGDQRFRDYEFDRSATQVDDPMMLVAQPNSILLSRAFAERHGLTIGSTVALFAAAGRKDFVVRGVFKPVGIGEVFGGNIAVMDIYSAQVMFGRGHNFDRIDILNSPGVAVEAVKNGLRDQLPSAAFEVERPGTRGQALENTVAALRLLMQVSSFVALLVGVYIIFNSFSIAVNQRWQELGILRAIGVERRNVSRMFLLEALVMGSVGSVIGIVAGFYLAAAASRVMGNIAASVYGTVSTPQPATLRIDFAVTSFVLGVAASLLGAWLPARAAARLDPVLALHNIEARSQEALLGGARTIAGAVLTLGSVALIAWTPVSVGTMAQFVYAAVMLLGLTLLLPKLVEVAAQALRPVMDRWGGAEGALAVDAMIQSPRRCSATVGALMVGLMFAYSTGAYIQSYRRMIDRWMSQMVNADLFAATSTNLRSSTYHFTEDVGKQIAELAAVKRLENVRFAAIRYRGDAAALIAIEMDGFLARASDAVTGWDTASAEGLLEAGKGVLVSRNFARRWQVDVGARLTLDAPGGQLDLPVLGLVDDYRSDKGTIFMDRALYKRAWNDSGVDFFDISLKSGADSVAAKHEVERILAGQVRAFVYTNAEFRKWVAGLVDQFFLLNYMQLVVAVLVSMLGIANTLFISITERRRETGIIRAVGGFRWQIRKMVLLEAAALAILGVAIGALAGMGSTLFMTRVASLTLAGYDMPFSFPWVLILASLPVVVLASLAAAWWPAQLAVKAQVAEAIGYE